MPKPPEADRQLDASGLRCPMPVLRAQKCLRDMQTGQVLHVISSDNVSVTEFPAFCQQTGYALLHTEVMADQLWHFWLKKQ
jgi:tRNA 2-thiouridine synthesizing protein A